MGQIDIPGNISGTTYRFTIAGDQPTRDELSRMQAVISDGEAQYQQEFEASTGLGIAVDDQPGTAIGRGLRRGIPQFQSALGTAAEYAGLEGIGDYLQRAAREREIALLEENPALLEGATFRDVRGLGSALTYAGELVGEQLPLIGGTIGVGAATGGAGALAGLGTAAATGLGTVAGTAAVSGPTLFGSNIERQEAQVAAGELARVDVGAAANAAVAQTGLELLSNLILVGRIPSTLARAIAQNATAEGLTEVGQQALERQQAGLPVDSDDAVQEYLDAAVAGATLGAGFGAISRFAPGRDQTEERQEELLALPPPTPLPLPTPPRGLPAPPRPPTFRPRIAGTTTPAPETLPDDPNQVGTVPGSRVEGAEDRGRSPAPTPPIRVAPEEGQVRPSGLNVPGLSSDAAVTARSVGSDPQMLAAVEAIQSSDRATIPTIQNALGLSYNAARGVMQKLEQVGAVSPARGGQRTLTLPFQISAVPDGQIGEVDITPEGGTTTRVDTRQEGRRAAPEAAPTITTQDLDTLGVPPNTAVYQGVRSGTLTDDAAIEAALDRYTRATRDADRAARVRNFVEGRRATQVQPSPEETEAQLRAAAEPDRPVDQRDGARDEGGGRGVVGGPRPVVDQPAGEPAAPEPGGLDAGELDLDGPAEAAGDVQPALTPEAEPAPRPTKLDTQRTEAQRVARETGMPQPVTKRGRPDPEWDGLPVTEVAMPDGSTVPIGVTEGFGVGVKGYHDLTDPNSLTSYLGDTKEQALETLARRGEDVTATPTAPAPDPDTLSAPQRVLDVPLGDTVVEALRAGDIRAALERLPAALSDRTMGKLARRLLPFMDGVTPSIVPATDPRLVARDGTVRPGAYLPSTGELLLNAETGLNPQTLLHEAVHAATISVLSNPSHPLARQIEQIRERAVEVLPPYTYGLQDRFEFVSEGMTNPEFIQDLSYVETPMGDERVSLGRRFVTAVTNFLRGLVNQPKRPFRPAKTELDNLFESLLAPAAEYRGTGTLIDALYGPGRIERAKKMLGSLSERTVEATPKNMAEVRKTIRDVRIPVAAKDAIARWAVPLPFIVQYASKYMPSAPLQKQAMDALHAEQRNLNDKVKQTGKAIGEVYAKYQDRINDMERVRLGMSEPGAMFDIRKPYEYYSKYYFEFNVLDNEGNIIGTRRSKPFNNAGARNRGMGRFNDNLPKNRTSATAVNPRTPEQLARQKEIRRIHASLPKEAQKAIERALALPESLLGELQEALRGRVAAISEDARQTTRVMNTMYSKIFSPNLIEGYQGFIRKGDYGMSYEATDPDTGEVVVFKHSFQSPSLRLKAQELLAQKGDDVAEIKFYQTGGQAPRTRDVRPSLRFVSDILAAVERSGQPENDALKEEILDLYWDATPESSFAQTFRRRFGTPGYEQDQTLLSLEPNAGAAMDNIVDANSRLAYQITGIKYGNRIEELNAQLDLELQRSVDQANQTITNPVELDANIREAYMHRNILRDYSKKPLQKNAPWTATLNSGLYALTLGLNVSSVAIQTFHVPMFTVTYQAPKYGTRNTTQGMGVASRYITKSGRQRTLERVGVDGKTETFREDVRWWNASLQNYDYANDAKVRWLSPLNAAMEQNGVYTDSVALEMAGDIYDLDAPGRRTPGSLVRKGAAVSGLMQHQVERYIRETVTMNAYMNMLKKTNPTWDAMSLKQFVRAMENGRINPDPDVAAQIARDAVTEGELLNGSIYSSSGSLKSTEDGWNVVFLFKKFGLSMMNLLFHTAMRSVPPLPDPSDPGYAAALQDRRVARLQFASMAGSIGLLSGAAGMPMFGAIANLYNLLKDDEDEDLETLVRTGVLGEFGLNGAVNYITGLNIAPRIGMSGIFYREPFNAENNTPLTNLIEGLGGPAVGMFNKYTDRAFQLFQDGEIWRGTEAVMPSFVANGLRTIRVIQDDGFLTMRGDAIVDDISPFHLAGQFFGFQPAEYAQQLAINSQQRGMDNAINRQRSRLLSRLYRAYRARDLEEYREVMADIQEFNREVPTPDQRIERTNIRQSLNSHRATTARTVNGIAYSTTNERWLRQTATDYGPVSFLD